MANAANDEMACVPPWWSEWKRWVPLLLMVVVLGMAWKNRAEILDNLLPSDRIKDLFQEWASARNHWQGRPVYASQRETYAEYVGGDRGQKADFERNLHPPTSTFLCLPLGWLEYQAAQGVWVVLSLVALSISCVLILRNLAIPWSAGWLPVAVLLFFSNPVQTDLEWCNWSSFLLLLLTGVWLAGRSGQVCWAGMFLALAVAVKLSPGFLLVYFVARGQWRVVFWTAAWLTLLVAVSLLVLGPGTYVTYVLEVLPLAGDLRSCSWNHSLSAFWHKLFDPGPMAAGLLPLARWPAVDWTGTALSCLAITAVCLWRTRQARTQADADAAFGLTLVGCVLVSPVAWSHYLLLLVLPLLVWWRYSPVSGILLWPWVFSLFVLWQETLFGPKQFRTCWAWCTSRDAAETPLYVLAGWAWPTYALLGVFILGLVQGLRAQGQTGSQ